MSDTLKYLLMNNNYPYALLILLFIATLTLSNCTREPNCNETSYETVDLTADELRKIPYTGLDTLYFLNKQGDTCIVRGTGKQYYYEAKNESGTPDCPPVQTTYYQAYKINFIPIKNDLKFDIVVGKLNRSISVYHYFNEKNNQPFFSLLFSDLDSDSIPGYPDPDYNSLIINDNYYYFVDSMVIIQYSATLKESGYKALLNSEKGLLYLKSIKDLKEYSIITKP